MSQVSTELQLMTLLDDLKSITDNPKQQENYTYKDILFVIEEIDTDPRGICLQRSVYDMPTAPVNPLLQPEEEEEEKQEELPPGAPAWPSGKQTTSPKRKAKE